MFKEVADIKTADQLKLPTPTPHYETVVVQPTEIQKAMVQSLSERAVKVHSGSVDPRVDNMLKITSDGRKLGLDQRLINPLLPDDPGSKVNACVKNIFRIWQEGTDDRLTQLVFCDISTPKGMERTSPQTDTAEKTDSPRDEDDLPPLEPVDDLMELAGASSEAVVSDFNVYEDIRSKLIARGVPPEEIAFIHDANTEVKKKELFAKVRAGQVRVLLGSTAKMGAGTNCQDRLIALHDLDCPWRPGDLEQRSGRIVRQGNMNPDVQIYRYATEGTFDSYLWQTVENKQKFISQIMTSKSPVRSCEDIDEAALSYAEIKALCAGDPAIKEKMDLDVDVARLRLMKADHQSQQYRLEDRLLKFFPQEIERNQGYIRGFEQDQATVAAHPLPEKDFIGMTIGGETFTEAKDAGEAILAACKQVSNEKDHALGEYRGFSMSIMYNPMSQMYQLTLKGAMSHQVELGSDPRGNITRIDNALAGMCAKIGGNIMDQLSYGSDLGKDVRIQYIDALRRGKDSTEATNQLIADYEPSLFDEEDAPRFWFALADVQWNLGRLEETVKHHALVYIEKELECAKLPTSDAVCIDIPINVLTMLKQKLSSPQPPQKKIKQYRLYHTDWKKGDVFAYCLNCADTDYPDFHNRYVYFVVKDTETWHPGHTIPVVYVYWVTSKELLSLDCLQKQEYLPQFYAPIAYRNNPGMKRKYSLALLCTSARAIPKKKLTYLGNVGCIKTFDNDDLNAYPVAWKDFDKYMIKNYVAWTNNCHSRDNEK